MKSLLLEHSMHSSNPPNSIYPHHSLNLIIKKIQLHLHETGRKVCNFTQYHDGHSYGPVAGSYFTLKSPQTLSQHGSCYLFALLVVQNPVCWLDTSRPLLPN